MKRIALTTKKTFTPAPMNQEQLKIARDVFQASKEAGRRFNAQNLTGRTVGLMQVELRKNILNLRSPYKQKMFNPLLHNPFPRITGGFEEKEQSSKSITNFQFKIVAVINTFSSESKYERSIKVSIEMTDSYDNGTGKVFFFEIPLEQYTSMARYLTRYHPQCIVRDDKAFSEKLAEEYNAIETSKVMFRYEYAGWMRQEDGRLKFINSAMPNVKSKVFLQGNFESSRQFLPIYWRLSCEKNKLLILLLFVLWAGLARLFEEACLEMKGLRSVLYLSAPSGTGKTTIASLFTKAFLKKGANYCLRFEDTGPNIEESLLINRDIPTLIDDFFAQGTKIADAEYEKKASSITRIAGDGCLRGKLGSDRKLRPERRYRGTIICTGEYVSLNTHSSVLRCWQLFFPKHSIVLGKDMDFLERNIDIPRSFVSGWIDFLEKNQESIIHKLPEIQQRNECIAKMSLVDCKYSRLITHTAALLTIGELFENYTYNLGEATENVQEMILAQAKEQLSAIEKLDPVEIWIKCIRTAIESGRLNLAENESKFQMNQCDGYIDSQGNYCCISGRVDDFVTKISYEHRLGLKITQVIKNELVERGILKPGANNEISYKYSKNRKVSPHRPRVYLISLKGDI